MITGWGFLRMDLANLGFGKMAPPCFLTCKCLREKLRFKKKIHKEIQMFILFYTLDVLQKTQPSLSFHRLLIGIEVE